MMRPPPLLYAQLEARETSQGVMRALATVIRAEGLPMALYTDRAGWAFYTPTATGPVDKTRLTQVGRALRQLGIEHISAYSPQARGRSERMNRTLQGRLINELRVARITAPEAANAYLRDVYVPQHNATFARPPRDPASAWVSVGAVDLDQILCHQETRVVAPDNTQGSFCHLDRPQEGEGIHVTIPTGMIKNESVQACYIWNYGSR